MKLSEKIQEALREQQVINLSDPAVQKRLAAQWGYVPAGAQPAPTIAEQDQINAEAAIRSIYGARPKDEALWQTIANGMITPAHIAQSAPSVPEDVLRDAKRYRFLRAPKNITISTEAARDPIVYDAAIDAAMLAAAPEANQ